MNIFLEETKDTRKQLTVKRSERGALMSQDNPDEKKVAKLTGEIFNLKNLKDEKQKRLLVTTFLSMIKGLEEDFVTAIEGRVIFKLLNLIFLKGAPGKL